MACIEPAQSNTPTDGSNQHLNKESLAPDYALPQTSSDRQAGGIDDELYTANPTSIETARAALENIMGDIATMASDPLVLYYNAIIDGTLHDYFHSRFTSKRFDYLDELPEEDVRRLLPTDPKYNRHKCRAHYITGTTMDLIVAIQEGIIDDPEVIVQIKKLKSHDFAFQSGRFTTADEIAMVNDVLDAAIAHIKPKVTVHNDETIEPEAVKRVTPIPDILSQDEIDADPELSQAWKVLLSEGVNILPKREFLIPAINPQDLANIVGDTHVEKALYAISAYRRFLQCVPIADKFDKDHAARRSWRRKMETRIGSIALKNILENRNQFRQTVFIPSLWESSNLRHGLTNAPDIISQLDSFIAKITDILDRGFYIATETFGEPIDFNDREMDDKLRIIQYIEDHCILMLKHFSEKSKK